MAKNVCIKEQFSSSYRQITFDLVKQMKQRLAFFYCVFNLLGPG